MPVECFHFQLGGSSLYDLPKVTPGADGWGNGLAVRMPNHLGDCVMALPALHQLKAILPEHCGLFVIAPAYLGRLFAQLPFVDVFLALAQPHRIWQTKEIVRLREMQAGAGVLFNNSFRDALMMKAAGVRELYGTAARGRSFLLKQAFAMPWQQKRKSLAGEHLSWRYCAIAEALGAPAWDGTLPEFRFMRTADELKYPLLNWCSHPKLLTIGPGAAFGEAKRWPSKNFTAVAAHWIKQGGAVAVLGSEAEEPIGQKVVKELDPRKSINLCGKTDLFDLIQLLRHSKASVCNDCGIMHLSAVLGIPGVAVFGSTDYTATGPISPLWSCLYSKCECAPCFLHECPGKDRLCLRQISADDVIAELDRIIQRPLKRGL